MYYQLALRIRDTFAQDSMLQYDDMEGELGFLKMVNILRIESTLHEGRRCFKILMEE